MKVYFVRHGQSIFNKEERHQFPDTPLSETGLLQAENVANRFKDIPLDKILTSPYTRALQTAQAIERTKSIPLISNDLLIERTLPTIFRGKLHGSAEIASIHQLIRDHTEDPNWHHSDEENFSDLVKRSQEALRLIESQPEENIVIVTHGYFLTLMIVSILFEKEVSSKIFKVFRDHIKYSNTGLTMCEFNDNIWTLLTWNDHAHLGE